MISRKCWWLNRRMRKKEQIDHAAETIADLFECNYEHHLGKYALQILFKQIFILFVLPKFWFSMLKQLLLFHAPHNIDSTPPQNQQNLFDQIYHFPLNFFSQFFPFSIDSGNDFCHNEKWPGTESHFHYLCPSGSRFTNFKTLLS